MGKKLSRGKPFWNGVSSAEIHHVDGAGQDDLRKAGDRRGIQPALSRSKKSAHQFVGDLGCREVKGRLHLTIQHERFRRSAAHAFSMEGQYLQGMLAKQFNGVIGGRCGRAKGGHGNALIPVDLRRSLGFTNESFHKSRSLAQHPTQIGTYAEHVDYRVKQHDILEADDFARIAGHHGRDKNLGNANGDDGECRRGEGCIGGASEAEKALYQIFR